MRGGPRVRDRGAKIVSNKVHTLPAELSHHMSDIVTDRADVEALQRLVGVTKAARERVQLRGVNRSESRIDMIADKRISSWPPRSRINQVRTFQ
jgi:hypothetical protein